jgi:hypothetical protein
MAGGTPNGAFSLYADLRKLVEHGRDLVRDLFQKIPHGGKFQQQGRPKGAN